jgi:hypothetical protein
MLSLNKLMHIEELTQPHFWVLSISARNEPEGRFDDIKRVVRLGVVNVYKSTHISYLSISVLNVLGSHHRGTHHFTRCLACHVPLYWEILACLSHPDLTSG